MTVPNIYFGELITPNFNARFSLSLTTCVYASRGTATNSTNGGSSGQAVLGPYLRFTSCRRHSPPQPAAPACAKALAGGPPSLRRGRVAAQRRDRRIGRMICTPQPAAVRRSAQTSPFAGVRQHWAVLFAKLFIVFAGRDAHPWALQHGMDKRHACHFIIP